MEKKTQEQEETLRRAMAKDFGEILTEKLEI